MTEKGVREVIESWEMDCEREPMNDDQRESLVGFIMDNYKLTQPKIQQIIIRRKGDLDFRHGLVDLFGSGLAIVANRGFEILKVECEKGESRPNELMEDLQNLQG